MNLKLCPPISQSNIRASAQFIFDVRSSSEPYHLSMFPGEHGSNPLGPLEDKVMKGENYEEKGQISTPSNQNRRASGS